MKSIKIENLTKYYGNTQALNDVSLDIETGKIYGLLGRNGAGKTTLINLVTDKIFPTSGKVLIDGEDVSGNDKVLGRIYYMMEKNLFPDYMKVKESFKWTHEFYPGFDMEYARMLSKKFGLSIDKKIKSLSTGYCTIFKAVTALASNAPLMIFDEPVLGLDANHRDLFYKELLANYTKEAKTMILSTHLIEEVADVLEEAIIIKDGRIILKKSVEDLLEGAYTVSGEITKVDEYVSSRKYTGAEIMGKFKSVTVLEEVKKRDMALINELGLDTGKVELQKLFIALTNV